MTKARTLEESELAPEVDARSSGAAADAGSPGLGATARRPDDLISREEAKRLSEKSDVTGLIYFCAHFGLIGVGGWLTWQTLPSAWFIPTLLLHSFIIGFLFSPLHECAHGTAFKTRWLNETALWITAVVYIVPPYYFRYFHLGHHRFTQVPGKDPSLVLPEPANFRQYLWYCAGLWFWWRNITWVIKHAAGIVNAGSVDYVPKQRLSLMVTEARIMTALYLVIGAAAIAVGLGLPLLLCWLLPRLLGEPIQRIIRVAEHVGCAQTPDLLENTRTTLSNPLMNAIAWQMPYHAEHHLFPNVPFHRLPALHRLVGSRVIVEPRGYIAGQRHIVGILRASGSKAGASASHPML
ncbi:MAG: fatty acid desaturase [Gammaproteobacteria bacterium]